MKLKMEIPVETVVWIDSEHAPGHFNLGLILAGQGDLDRAAEEFQEAVRLKPDYREAHQALGVVYRRRGDLKAAEEAFRQAQKLKPSVQPSFD